MIIDGTTATRSCEKRVGDADRDRDRDRPALLARARRAGPRRPRAARARGRRGARAQGLPPAQRSRAVAPTTGRFLFSLVAPQTDCEVLEIGGSRGYSSIWLGAGRPATSAGTCSRSSKTRPKAERWRRNVADAGLEELGRAASRATPSRRCAALEDVFDVVFLDAEKDDYEALFAPRAAHASSRAALVVADNVLSHAETLGAYSAARQADPTLVERDRAARPRPRADVVLGPSCAPPPFIVRSPRKGGGPTLNSDSTGSGGTRS